MLFLGELAALGTSVCWSFTSVFFTLAGRVVGSVAVNRVRLILAVLFLVATHQVLYGELFPLGAEPDRWLWLGLSGIIGLVIGDAFLFQAFIWIGPRLSMLLMALVPVISTILAWIFLDEMLTARQLAGIVVTIGGVAWVILDRSGAGAIFTAERGYLVGVLFGLAGATGQAVGLITAKIGLSGDFSPLSGTLMRMIVAAIVIWVLAALQTQLRATWRKVRENRRSFWHIVGGAFFGPFLGVSLSLAAVQATEVGIAATLMSLAPVFLLPLSRRVFGELFSWRSVAGTAIAISGVVLLMLPGS